MTDENWPGDGEAPVAVVTGASAGVGRAAALAFAEHGYRVALIARGMAGLEGARAEIEEIGGTAIMIPADVADADAMFAAADRIADEWGGIDVWVNNAMVTVYAPVDAVAPDEFRRVTEVTYLGTVHGTLAALRHMRETDTGTIVQVGSALAYRSIPLQSAYCAAKAASRAFTDALRSELIYEESAIRLTMVHLPAVNTPQFDWSRSRLPRKLQPVPPIYEPDTVAEEIVRAAEQAPRELWVGKPTIQAILGTHLAPGFLDWMMARKAWPGQMTDEFAEHSRADNLFEPVDVDAGAHGRFGDRSSSAVDAVPASTARLLAGAAGILLAAAAGAALVSLANRPPQKRISRG